MAAPDIPADRAAGKTTAPKRPLIMRYAARSDVGRVRAKNDDSAYVGRHLAVVADGMGGHAGGDVASAATVLDMIHLDHDDYDGDAGTVLADEIQTANSLLSELVHINPKLAGMGTTVTALLLAEGKLHFAHIGDSARLPPAQRRIRTGQHRPHLCPAAHRRRPAPPRRGGNASAQERPHARPGRRRRQPGTGPRHPRRPAR